MLIKDNLKIENNIIENQIATSNLIVEKPPVTQTQQQQFHWSVYPQEKMPDYIVEAKKRLGQIKQPHIAPNAAADKPPKTPKHPASPAPSATDSEVHNKFMTAHWSQIPNPSTPDYIKAIRKRLGDDRYRKTNLTKSNSFSNFKTDVSKAVSSPSPKPVESKEEQEPYKIPTYLNINNNVQITTSEPEHYANIMPAYDSKSEIESAVELVKTYDQKFKREDERQTNSRASTDSRLSSVSKKPNPNMITFDTWLRNHATQKGSLIFC